jgi:hypothetical protein
MSAATGIDRLRNAGIGAAIAGGLLCAAAGFAQPGRFLLAYLVAFLFFLALAVGSVAVLMLHHLVGGMWGHVVRRVLEAAAGTLPWMALLFLPVLIGMGSLYSWSRPGAVATDAALAAKAIYLNPAFFAVRALFYFAVWIGLTALLTRWSGAQDAAPASTVEGEPPLGRRFRMISGPGLALYGLTMTFAAIDWVMSLDPHWYSTVYGVLFIVGQGLTTIAFATLAATLLRRRPPLDTVVEPGHLNDLGNLMLTFVMLWAYIAYSQLLIIWSGNLEEEIPWYALRLGGGRQGIALALVIFHFGLPFLLLLHRPIKRNPRAMEAIAALILAMRIVDLHWIVAPAAPDRGALFYGYEAAALLGIGGVWVAAFATALRKRPLLPRYRPDGSSSAAPAASEAR